MESRPSLDYKQLQERDISHGLYYYLKSTRSVCFYFRLLPFIDRIQVFCHNIEEVGCIVKLCITTVNP